MNINNLELNIKYKNYKEMCKVLEEPIKTGNAKQAQLKEWECYFNFHKDGNGFIVTKKYNKLKEKVDDRKGHSGKSIGSRNNNNKYGKYLDVLIENFLYKCNKKKKVIYITNSCLAQMTKMVNFNYRVCVGNREKFHGYVYVKYNCFTKEAENDVFNCIYSKMRPAITSALNRLRIAGKIKYTATYIIYFNGKQEAVTMQENKDIVKIEDNILKEMNISRKQIMWNYSKRKEFYNKTNDKIIEYFQNKDKKIDGIYQGYKIYAMKNLKAQKNVKALEKKFNNIFATDVMNSIQKNITKIKQRYADKFTGIGTIKYDKWDENRMGLKYLKNTERIIKILVSYSAINICREINKAQTQKEYEDECEELF